MRLFVVLIIGVLCSLQLSGLSEAKPWLKELLELKKALLSKAIEYMPQSRAPTLKKELQDYKLLCIDEVNEYTLINMPETHDQSVRPETPQDGTNFNNILQALRDVSKKEENMAQKKLIEQIMILVQNSINKKSERDSHNFPSESALVAIKELFVKDRNYQNERSKQKVPNYAEILKILLGEKRVPDSGKLDLTVTQESIVEETHQSKSHIEEALGFVVDKVLPSTQGGSFNFTIELEQPDSETTLDLHEFKELSNKQADNDAVKPRSWSVDATGKASIWGGAQVGFGKLGLGVLGWRSPRDPYSRTEKQSRIIKAELNRLIKLCVQRKVLQAKATKKLLAISNRKS
ncbi:uncharacterized protein Dwil_GK27844 [Drosophila willistoni]|uniref:uncharacterized protein LOC26529846 n=1 Tax=Drosophila willistoni TaxID=7260 RepID=UPI000732A009|nr:uncharacterized protein LOC26529846 [Drosophila willistoni]KRF98039.1 uncharacterized protein Dwil_GK27844 [Drosophila willistoni]